MEEKNLSLIAAAQNIIKQKYKENKHEIGAAVLTKNNKIYSAVHLETYVGRAAICAEAIAIGMMISNGESEFDAIVAVNREDKIVSPCGSCRELISDYCPEAKVIVLDGKDMIVESISKLLPKKYRRNL